MKANGNTTEKLTDKMFTWRITLCLVAIFACIISLTVTTYALFTVDISSSSDSHVDASPYILKTTLDEGQAVDTTYQDVTTINASAGDHSLVLLNPCAISGFAIVTLQASGSDDQVYYLERSPEESRVISITLLSDSTITVRAHWGEYEAYAKSESNPNGYEYTEFPRPTRSSNPVLTFGAPVNRTFEARFTDDATVIVGNKNALTLGDLFRLKSTAVDFAKITVRSENSLDAAGTAFEKALTKETWEQEEIHFFGKGEVRLSIAEDDAELSASVTVQVADAVNVSTFEKLKEEADEETPEDIAVFDDLAIEEDEEDAELLFSGITVYGNGFTLDVTNGRYTAKKAETPDGSEDPVNDNVPETTDAETPAEASEPETAEAETAAETAEETMEEAPENAEETTEAAPENTETNAEEPETTGETDEADTAAAEEPKEYVISLKDATMKDLTIIGKVQAAPKDEKSEAAVEMLEYAVITVSGDSVIENCTVSNGIAPVRFESGTLTLKNVELAGGSIANLLWYGGDLTLEDVETVNRFTAPEEDEKDVLPFGFGILALKDGEDEEEESAGHRTLTIRGSFAQDNFLREDDDRYFIADERMQIVFETLFGEEFKEFRIVEEIDEKTERLWMHAGFVSLTNEVGAHDIVIVDKEDHGFILDEKDEKTDSGSEGYEFLSGTLKGSENGYFFLYALKETEPATDQHAEESK